MSAAQKLLARICAAFKTGQVGKSGLKVEQAWPWTPMPNPPAIAQATLRFRGFDGDDAEITIVVFDSRLVLAWAGHRKPGGARGAMGAKTSAALRQIVEALVAKPDLQALSATIMASCIRADDALQREAAKDSATRMVKGGGILDIFGEDEDEDD